MRSLPVAVFALVTAATACTGSSHPAPAVKAPPTSTSTSTAATPAAAGLGGKLRVAWSVPLDAAMYARPLVAGSVAVAATENNTVYAADLGTGRLAWRRHLVAPARRAELPCGNIDPSGITGTPAYDASSGLVFVATETHAAKHTLYALDVRTGQVRWHRALDVLAHRDPRAQQQRGALLATAGRVYVPFGGRYGDCGNYVGYIAAVPVTGNGAAQHYAIPTAREGGMWAAGGLAVGPGGEIYAASGNGAEVGGSYDGSDSVIRLTTSLSRTAFFAPRTWRQDNEQDLDLGSMSPIVVGNHVVIAGKRGRVFLLSPSLGGIGGDVAHLDGCAGFGSGAASGSIVALPCDDGIRALRTSGDRMHWSWHNAKLHDSPLIAGSSVFAFDSRDLLRADLGTGNVTGRVKVGDVTRFAAPVATPSLVLVGTTTRLVAVR